MIYRGDEEIDQIAGRNFLPNSVTDEYYDAYASGALAGIIIVRQSPLISVRKLEYQQIGGTWISGFQGSPGDPTNTQGLEPYYVYPKKNTVIWHKLRLDGRNRYRIAYNWGYATVPENIRSLSMFKTARQVIIFWGGQFGNQEINQENAKRIDKEIARITAKTGVVSIRGVVA